jgi:excisionase family DNA binding protein
MNDPRRGSFMNSSEILMTRSFVARTLEVSEGTVDNLARSGRLPSIMTTAKRRVFRKSDVEACKAGLRNARREPVEAA